MREIGGKGDDENCRTVRPMRKGKKKKRKKKKRKKKVQVEHGPGGEKTKSVKKKARKKKVGCVASGVMNDLQH